MTLTFGNWDKVMTLGRRLLSETKNQEPILLELQKVIDSSLSEVRMN